MLIMKRSSLVSDMLIIIISAKHLKKALNKLKMENGDILEIRFVAKNLSTSVCLVPSRVILSCYDHQGPIKSVVLIRTRNLIVCLIS